MLQLDIRATVSEDAFLVRHQGSVQYRWGYRRGGRGIVQQINSANQPNIPPTLNGSITFQHCDSIGRGHNFWTALLVTPFGVFRVSTLNKSSYSEWTSRYHPILHFKNGFSSNIKIIEPDFPGYFQYCGPPWPEVLVACCSTCICITNWVCHLWLSLNWGIDSRDFLQ